MQTRIYIKKSLKKLNISFFSVLFTLFLTVSTTSALVIIPNDSAITDPLTQGYPTCNPGNCVVATSSGTVSSSSIVDALGTSTLGAYASTSIGASVFGAVPTGIFFLDPTTGKLSQDTANFNYDPITKKLKVTGGIDPLYFSAQGTSTNNNAFFESYGGENSALSSGGTTASSTGRLRYNAVTQVWEVSTNGGVYQPLQVSSGSISWLNATGGNATVTNIFATNASITNATSTNFFSNILNAITSTFTNLFATNATLTNATKSFLFIYHFFVLGSQMLFHMYNLLW